MTSSVGVLIVTEDQGALRFCLQKRCFSSQIMFRGYWGVFGGKLESGETPRQGAQRELHEELGFVVEDLNELMRIEISPNLFCNGNLRIRHYFYARVPTFQLQNATCLEGLGFNVFEADKLPGYGNIVPWDASAISIFLAKNNPLNMGSLYAIDK